MFIHHSKLDHLLRPRDYSSVEFWEDEITHLFQRSWQFAGLAKDVSRPGDYLARDVAGLPVLIRNFNGELKAFKNVCPHRHSMIVRPGVGSQPELKCMYHGWQFGAAGQISHMPDGVSFRGIKGTNLCLESLRVEQIGPMLFVNPSPGTETFRESLGALAPEIDQYFADHKPIWHWITDHDSNWKVIEENAVESYHVPNAHPRTFVNFKDESMHDHALEKAYTRYADTEPWKGGIVDKGFKALSKFLLPNPNYERFKHTHIFPNNLLYYNEIFSTWAFLQPLTPERTRYEILGFIPRNIRGGFSTRFALRWIIQPLIKQFARILLEDMEIWPKIHKGLKHSHYTGALSCREERVYAFQRYVIENMPARHGLVLPESPTSS